MKSIFRTFIVLLVLGICSGCDSSTRDLIDLALDPPSRKRIDTDRMGVNAFFSNPGFGSIESRYSDIRNNLRLNHVRVLFAWTDGVQPTPNSAINWGFFDEVINSIPPGVDALVVVAHTPSWMNNPSNWVAGNPRVTWVERFLKPALRRYRSKPGIVGWEIFNEPNLIFVPSDAALELENPANYMELLTLGSGAVREIDPARLVVIAATESINQKFPDNLNYHKQLRDLGAVDLVDVWNFHYYGKQFENVLQSDGIKDFLGSIPLPIWLTESGEQGVNQQLAYVETAWPFLRKEISGLDRIYYYQYTSTLPADISFGLRTNDPSFPVSDLYLYLRDR